MNPCQFCGTRVTEFLERILDGKTVPMCRECRLLARGCHLYRVVQLGTREAAEAAKPGLTREL